MLDRQKESLHLSDPSASSQQLYFSANACSNTSQNIYNETAKSINFSEVRVLNVAIDVVDGCNLRCIGCPNSITKPTVHPIPQETILRRIKNIDIGVIDNLRLYRFGEPLFNPELPSILHSIKTLQKPKVLSISLSTNGQHRNLSILEESLKTGCIDKISISADGDGTKEMFERMRPPGKWEILTEFIKNTKRLISKFSPGTKITMGITLPPIYNKKTTRHIISGKHQANWRTQFSEYIDEFDFHSLLKMPGSLLAEQDFFSDKSLYDPPKIGACPSVLRGNIYIDGKGIVQPCCWASEVSNLGDLNSNTYSEIFIKRLQFKKALDERRSEIKACSECPSHEA